MAYYIFRDIHIHNTSQLQLEMEKQGMATGSKQSSTLANWRNCHPVLQLRCPKEDKKPWTFLWTSCRKQEILLKFATSDSKGCIILSWNKGVDNRWSTSSRNGIIRSKGKLYELMWFILDRFYIKYQFTPTGPIEKTWIYGCTYLHDLEGNATRENEHPFIVCTASKICISTISLSL